MVAVSLSTKSIGSTSVEINYAITDLGTSEVNYLEVIYTDISVSGVPGTSSTGVNAVFKQKVYLTNNNPNGSFVISGLISDVSYHVKCFIQLLNDSNLTTSNQLTVKTLFPIQTPVIVDYGTVGLEGKIDLDISKLQEDSSLTKLSIVYSYSNIIKMETYDILPTMFTNDTSSNSPSFQIRFPTAENEVIPDDVYVEVSTFTSRVGEDSAMSNTFVVENKPVPNAVLQSNLSAVYGDSQIVMSWVAPYSPGHYPITGYLVSVYEINGTLPLIQVGEEVLVGPDVLSYTFIQLANGTHYSTQVKAVNANGSSSATSVSGYPYRASDMVDTLTYSAADESITFNWTAPSYTGGFAVSGYRLLFNGSVEVDVSANVLSQTYTGLTNGSLYSIVVTPLTTNLNDNSTVFGAEDSISGYPCRASSMVNSLEVIPSDQSLTFNWAAPSDNGGLDISGYRLSLNGGAPLDLDADVLTHTYTGLTNGSLYSLVVKPLTINPNDNSIVVGAENSVSGYPYRASDKVNSLAIVTSDESLTFNWTAPSNNGGFAISGYRLLFSEGEQSSIDVSANVLSQTYSGILNGNLYDFVIQPLTINLNDNSTVFGAEDTISGYPYRASSMVNSLEVIPSDQSLTFNWAAPSDNGGFDISGYRLSLNGGASLDLAAGVLTHTYTGLTNGSLYSLVVKPLTTNLNDNSIVVGAEKSVSGYPYRASDKVNSLSFVASDQSLIFNWTAPSYNGGFAVSGYRVSFNGGDAVDVSANVFSQTYAGLTNGNLYSFVVKPLTTNLNDSSIVVGAEDSISGYPYRASDMVDSLAVVTSDESLTFNWTAPSYTGGFSISGYRLSLNGGASLDLDADVLTHTYNGLTNGTLYSLVVKPLTTNLNDNSIVVGAEKSVSGYPYRASNIVTSLSFIASDQSLTFNWAAPSDNGGFAISGYRLSFNGGDAVDVASYVLSKTYTGLTNGTSYTFSIIPITINLNTNLEIVGVSQLVPSAIPFGNDKIADAFSDSTLYGTYRFGAQSGTYSETRGSTILYKFGTTTFAYPGLYNGTSPIRLVITINENNVETPYYTKNEPLVNETIYLTGSVSFVNDIKLKIGTKYIVKGQYVFNNPNKNNVFCANPNLSAEQYGGFATRDVYPVKDPSNVSGLSAVCSESVRNQLDISWSPFPVNDVSFNGGFPVIRYDVYYRVNGATSYVLHGSAPANSTSYSIPQLYISNEYDVLVKTISLNTSVTPNAELISSGASFLKTMVYSPPLVPDYVEIDSLAGIAPLWHSRNFSNTDKVVWSDVNNKNLFTQVTNTEEYKLVFASYDDNKDIIRPNQSPPMLDRIKGDGWYFKNSTQGNNINWYHQVPPKTKVSDIKNIALQLKLHSNSSVPFIQIYTKKKEDGLDKSWYRSRYNYEYLTPSSLIAGSNYSFQFKRNVSDSLFTINGITSVELPLSNSVGSSDISTGATLDDEVHSIAISTNSSAAANAVEFVVQSLIVVRGNTAMSHRYGWDDFQGCVPSSSGKYSVKIDSQEYVYGIPFGSVYSEYSQFKNQFSVSDYNNHIISIVANGIRPITNGTAISSSVFTSSNIVKVDAAGPVSLLSRTANNQNVVVTWKDPTQLNGGTIIPANYNVTYDSNIFTAISSTPDVSGNIYTASINSLTNGTNYTFVVGGSTSVMSLWKSSSRVITTSSSVVNITTSSISGIPHGVPSIPQNVVCAEGDRQLTVSFSNSATGNGLPITKYILREGSTVIQEFTAGAGPYSSVITNLSNNVAKTYTITPYTNYDDVDIAGVVATTSGTPSGLPNITSVIINNNDNGNRTVTVTMSPNGSRITSMICIVDPVNAAITTDVLFKTANGNSSTTTYSYGLSWPLAQMSSDISNALFIVCNKNGFDVRDSNNTFTYP
jgi:hypothetical protein